MTDQNVKAALCGGQIKKPYRLPVLTVYGDLRVLTQTGTGNTNELVMYCPGTWGEARKC